MIDQDILDRMDNYFLGKLSEAEVASLLLLVEQNTDYAEAFELRRLEHDSLDILLEEEIRADFDNWDDEKGNTAFAPSTLRPWILPIAIAAALTLIISFFFIKQADYSNAALANNFYETDFSQLRSQGSGDDVFQDVEDILLNKRMDQYEQLATILSRIPASSDIYAEAQYYLGHLYFTQELYNSALAAFQNSSSFEQLKEDAQWYMALSHLGANELQAASDHINQIIGQANHKYNTKARELNRLLNSIWRTFN